MWLVWKYIAFLFCYIQVKNVICVCFSVLDGHGTWPMIFSSMLVPHCSLHFSTSTSCLSWIFHFCMILLQGAVLDSFRNMDSTCCTVNRPYVVCLTNLNQSKKCGVMVVYTFFIVDNISVSKQTHSIIWKDCLHISLKMWQEKQHKHGMQFNIIFTIYDKIWK